MEVTCLVASDEKMLSTVLRGTDSSGIHYQDPFPHFLAGHDLCQFAPVLYYHITSQQASGPCLGCRNLEGDRAG